MDIDQHPAKELSQNITQVPTNQVGSNLTKTTNPGTIPEQVSNKLIQEVLKGNVTVPLGPLLEISPIMRRDLLNAVKQPRGASRQTPEKREKTDPNEKTILGSNLLKPPSLTGLNVGAAQDNSLEVRDELLTVSAKIGEVKLNAVFDSGSQVNVLSEDYAEVCGLPIQKENLDRYKLTGVDGKSAQCVGIIPRTTILLTESELETIGQPIVVVKNSTFALLLG
jgi:hypothetical protein